MKNNKLKLVIKGVFLLLFIIITLFIGKKYPESERLVTIIMIFIIPILNYLLFKNIYGVLIVFLLCIKLGSYFLPLKDNFSQFFFTNKYIRLIIILYAISKVLNLVYFFTSTLYKELSTNVNNKDYYLIIQSAFQKIYPDNARYANLIAQEFSVIAYGIFLWRKPICNDKSFSYTRTSSSLVIYLMLFLVAIIETLCLHLVLFHFQFYTFSFILLFLNIYTALSLIAHLKAMKMRPIIWSNDKLLIKNGLFANATLDVSNIDSIEVTDKIIDIIKQDKKIKMALLRKIEMHNIKISLKEDIDVHLFYGLKKVVNEVYFYVDDKILFLDEVQIKKNAWQNSLISN